MATVLNNPGLMGYFAHNLADDLVADDEDDEDYVPMDDGDDEDYVDADEEDDEDEVLLSEFDQSVEEMESSDVAEVD